MIKHKKRFPFSLVCFLIFLVIAVSFLVLYQNGILPGQKPLSPEDTSSTEQEDKTFTGNSETDGLNQPDALNRPEHFSEAENLKGTDNSNESDQLKEADNSNKSDSLKETDNSNKPEEEEAMKKETIRKQAAELLASMSLEQKAAQLFFITPEALTGLSVVTTAGEHTAQALREYPVGGLIFFTKNLISPKQTKDMLSVLQQQISDIQGFSIFLGVDEEGGRVLRIGNNPDFQVEPIKAMGILARQQDLQLITDAADTIGAYLSDLGFNVDFAPDADVLTNAHNQVIGDRSFGTDPQMVADMAWAFCEGLHAHAILAAYKHFPGHGETNEDSHTGYALSRKTLDELRKCDLIPFQSGCDKGVDFMMAAHISVPNVTGNELPASLSKELLTDLLRNEMGYQGIIITDALNMGAITNHYTSGEAAVLALQAGCDMLLMPESFPEAYSAVLEAVENGELSEERIDESVLRILETKLQNSLALSP